MKLVDREKIQKALRESVIALCQSSVDYDAELIVEGLLGITLDKREIILVKINEVVKQDGPKDLSIPKRSREKRKADADILNNNEPPSLVLHYPSKKSKGGLHSLVRQNFGHGSEVSQGEDSLRSGLPSSSGTLRMPIIPPEHVQNSLHRPGRNNDLNSMADKHSAISRILGNMNVPVLNIVPQVEEGERGVNLSKVKKEQIVNTTYMPAYEGVDESNGLMIAEDGRLSGLKSNHSGVQKLHLNNNDKPQSYDSYLSPYMKSAMASTGSWVSTSTKSPSLSSTYNNTSTSSVAMGNSANQTTALTVDINIQPPSSAKTIVEGSGMLHSFDMKNEEKMSQSGPTDPSPSGGHAFTQKEMNEEPVSPSTVSSSGGKTPSSGGRGSKEFRRFRCTMCPASSSRKFNLQRHMKSHHPGYNDCYIIDLTPKERGHAKAGEIGYTPKLLSNQNGESNDDSSQAMDLSSPGFENWYGTTGEMVSPSPSFADSNLAGSSVDLSPQSKESVTSGNSNGESASKKVPERVSVGKSSKDGNSAKIRKGLDQMLFSKFGFYTNVQSENDNTEKSEKLDDAVGSASVFPTQIPLSSPIEKYNSSRNEESTGPNDINTSTTETLPFPLLDDNNTDEEDSDVLKMDLSPDVAFDKNKDHQSESQKDGLKGPLVNNEMHQNDAIFGSSFSHQDKTSDSEIINHPQKNRIELELKRDENVEDQSSDDIDNDVDTEEEYGQVSQSVWPQMIKEINQDVSVEDDGEAGIIQDLKESLRNDDHMGDMSTSESPGKKDNPDCTDMKSLERDTANDDGVKFDVTDEQNGGGSLKDISRPDQGINGSDHGHVEDPNIMPEQQLENGDEVTGIQNENQPVEENAYFVEGFSEPSDASSTKADANADDADKLVDEPGVSCLLDDEGETDDEEVVEDGGHHDNGTDVNHLSINDENANEDNTLCKITALRPVRKKSTEVSLKSRVSPRDSMKLRTRTLSGSGGKTS